MPRKKKILPSSPATPAAEKPEKKVARLEPDTSPLWKKMFRGSILAGLVIMLLSGHGVGFHSDEVDMNVYGKAVCRYYTSAGQDTSYLSAILDDSVQVNNTVMKTYGALFEIVAQSAVSLLGDEYEYNTRHVLTQLLGILTMMLAGLLCARLTGGYKSAFLAFWVLFLTPAFFGHSLFNTKDLPFAFSYMLLLYTAVVWFQHLPDLSWRLTLSLGLSMAVAMSVRVGGVLLLAFTGAFFVWKVLSEKDFKKQVLKSPGRYFLHLGTAYLLGFALTILLSPFLLQSPVNNFLFSLDLVSRFPQAIGVLFKGKDINSLILPNDFLVHWLQISLPVVVLALFVISLAIFPFIYTRLRNAKLLVLVLVAAASPVIYGTIKSFAFYSAWRHVLFIYPPMVVFACYWVEYVLNRRALTRYGFPLLLLLCFAHPVSWSIRNHPYEYLYFNETSGGFARNYYRYETDYWDISMKEAVDWVASNPQIRRGPGMTLGTNAPKVVKHILRTLYHDTLTRVRHATFQNKNNRDWDYCLLGMSLTNYNDIKNHYPGPLSIHTVNVDNKPISAVLLDTVRLDIKALDALRARKYREADSLFTLYLEKNPGTETVMVNRIVANLSEKRMDDVYNRSQEGLKLFNGNYYFMYYLGIAQALRGELDPALQNIETAYKNNIPVEKSGLALLVMLHTRKGNQQAAQYYQRMMESSSE